MNKQETQEAIEEVKNLLASFEENSEVVNMEDAATDTYGMEFEFTSALSNFGQAIAKLEARIASPEYNRPSHVPTNLEWFAEGETMVAEVIVDNFFVGGKWSIIVTEVPNYGFEVFLESDRDWSTSFYGFTSQANAQSAAQSAIEAVASVLTAYDGSEFVSEVFRGALVHAEVAQKVVA